MTMHLMETEDVTTPAGLQYYPHHIRFFWKKTSAFVLLKLLSNDWKDAGSTRSNGCHGDSGPWCSDGVMARQAWIFSPDQDTKREIPCVKTKSTDHITHNWW